MRGGRTSLTAEVAALIRATEGLTAREPVIRDAHAPALLRTSWRVVLARRWLRRLVVERGLLGALDGGAGGVLARARVHQDALRAALEAGIRQHVLLGAGLDCTGLGEPGLGRWEVDHPSSQRAKLERLRAAGMEDAATRFIPADLAADGLGAALLDGGFDAGARCLVGWLGCIQYLPGDDVERVLAELSRLMRSGSVLVADFLGEAPRTPVRRLGALLGEPVKSHHSPGDFTALLEGHGFSVVEHVDPGTAVRRWFPTTRNSPVPPPVHVHVVTAVRR